MLLFMPITLIQYRSFPFLKALAKKTETTQCLYLCLPRPGTQTACSEQYACLINAHTAEAKLYFAQYIQFILFSEGILLKYDLNQYGTLTILSKKQIEFIQKLPSGPDFILFALLGVTPPETKDHNDEGKGKPGRRSEAGKREIFQIIPCLIFKLIHRFPITRHLLFTLQFSIRHSGFNFWNSFSYAFHFSSS